MAEEKDNNKKKKETLDLLADKPKQSRRQRQREEAAKVKTVDDKKREALDIFAEDGKKKTSQVKKGNMSKKEILPSISKINEPKETDFVKSDGGSSSTSAESEASEAPATEAAADGANVIHLKPPIIVSDLADSMGLKPFQLMADLIKLEVFVAPHQAIEPDVAMKLCDTHLCDTHGFVYEREKREKGAGVHKVEEKFVEPEKEEQEPEEQMLAELLSISEHMQWKILKADQSHSWIHRVTLSSLRCVLVVLISLTLSCS